MVPRARAFGMPVVAWSRSLTPEKAGALGIDRKSSPIEVAESADRPDLTPDERLGRLVAALLDAYRDADAEHKVQINALALLPQAEQRELKALERRLVAIFAEAIRGVEPEAFENGRLLKPVTMSLFGMLNWFYMWFREDGAISRAEYADMATKMLVNGVKGVR